MNVLVMIMWLDRNVLVMIMWLDRNVLAMIMWLDCNVLVMIMWLDRNVLVMIMWLDCNVLVMIMWLDCNVLVMIMWLASIFYFLLLLELYWWKSDLSLAPIYWYVTEWEIWRSLYYDPHLSDLMSLIYSQPAHAVTSIKQSPVDCIKRGRSYNPTVR
jgi:hypothetical protein